MTEPLGLADALEDETSRTFVGQWQRLVSSTNWEKGRIIHHWRQALVDSLASPTQYSDEAWSRRVGNVSGQHVGRLRRVYERFGAVYASFAGLFWSHFQAAIDWNDAEMWLEGAVQNRWSVSDMRSSRWLAMGAPDEYRPRDEDVIAAEFDEDAAPIAATTTEIREPGEPDHGRDARASGPDYGQGPDFGDESYDPSQPGVPFDAAAADYPAAATGEPDRPFENLPELPPDFADAFEAFKLAILRHKLAGWSEVARDDVLSSLDALKQFACAAS
ncbi:MAG: hypothetical protein HYX69_16245 [Planctomycetia bacterium]|nr:hypothetical protein [Planctomycetia bacterium]